MERTRNDDTEPTPDDRLPVDPGAVRASDEERERVAALLGEHAALGRITLGELEERVGRAYAATTRAELAALTADLPELPRPTEPTTKRRTRRWLVAIFGGSNLTARHRLAERLNVVSLFGGDELDLRNAQIDGREITINTFAIFGGTTIYLPDSLDVELSGFALFGGNDELGSTRPPRPDAPQVRVRSIAIFGGVTVWRLPAEASGMSLKDARRFAKELSRQTRREITPRRADSREIGSR